jgi:glutaredoxin
VKKVQVVVAVICLSGIGFTGMASAVKVKGIDEYGVVHMDDSSQQKNEPGRDAEDHVGANVELYTTSWCSYCRRAREFFRSRSIAFTEYDVEKDREAAVHKHDLSGWSGVPVAVINGQVIRGFSKSMYQKALKPSAQ